MPKLPSSKSSEVAERAAYLMAGLSWQESLLQAYRNYLLVTQSIFLAVNVGLLASQASAATVPTKLIFYTPAMFVSSIGIATLIVLAKAVTERSKAVDWWQRRLLHFEKREDSSRHFATFRLAKEGMFEDLEIEATQLTEAQIESLLRHGPPKARQAFGIFVPGFRVLWLVTIGSATIDLAMLLTK